MIHDRLLRLTGMQTRTEPFPYFVEREAFGQERSEAVLAWLERESAWQLIETDFYEQYEFSLHDVRPPGSAEFLVAPGFLEDLLRVVARAFGVDLEPRVNMTVHKLIPGQRIRIHNDYIPGRETHRVIVQLNRGWQPEQGGLLMLFNSPDPSDVHRVLIPAHDSAVGFAISPKSHHAVSTTHAGERYTLVFSFYARAIL